MRKQNVNLLSNGVVNKTIKKDISKHSTKCAGKNIDKSAEFIYDDSEEKLNPKIFEMRKWKS